MHVGQNTLMSTMGVTATGGHHGSYTVSRKSMRGDNRFQTGGAFDQKYSRRFEPGTVGPALNHPIGQHGSDQ